MQIHQDARQRALAKDLAELASSPLEADRVLPDLGDLSAMQSLANSKLAALSRHTYEPGHFTASAFVLCPEARQLLLIRHRKLKMWLQPGGHIEATDRDWVAAARRELEEETGLKDVELQRTFFDLDVHQIPAHGDSPAHLHHDLRALFVAKSMEVCAASDVSDAQWFELQDLANEGFALPGGLTTDESVRRVVRFLLR